MKKDDDYKAIDKARKLALDKEIKGKVMETSAKESTGIVGLFNSIGLNLIGVDNLYKEMFPEVFPVEKESSCCCCNWCCCCH